MTRADNAHYLAEAAAERHREARRRATVAVKHLDGAGETVTFSAVAATAGVSRGWLYRQDDLRAAIIRLRPTAGRPVTSGATNQRASIDSLRQRLEATRAEVGPAPRRERRASRSGRPFLRGAAGATLSAPSCWS